MQALLRFQVVLVDGSFGGQETLLPGMQIADSATIFQLRQSNQTRENKNETSAR